MRVWTDPISTPRLNTKTTHANTHTQGVHTHAWGLKYLVFVGFLIGMFFVDNSAYGR